MTQTHLRLPITMAYAEGGYTVPVYVGSEKNVANVALDTGSSAFAIRESVAKPESDTSSSATSLMQVVQYGAGGWAGPVVNTEIAIGHLPNQIDLNSVPVALIVDEPTHNFYQADGIWGLAYAPLDNVYDIKDQLQDKDINPAVSYPWPDALFSQSEGLDQLQSQLKNSPESTIKPYFTELEEQHEVANKFALSTHRSIYHHTGPTPTSVADENDPLNKGLLVLGAGEECHDLYQGPLQFIQLVHEKYYNTHLTQVQVAGFAPFQVPDLEPQNKQAYASNSIFDCGSSFLIFENSTYQYVMECFTKLDASFPDLIKQSQALLAKQQGLDMSKLDLDKWPIITLTLKGVTENITMDVSPHHYWQENAPTQGEAMYLLASQIEGWAKQSILGLPLLNDYFCIFDRVDHCIKVATSTTK